MKSPCYLKGDFPRGWCPPGLYVQVGVVRTVIFMVSHEDFNFEVAVEASKNMVFLGCPWYVHLGTWDEFEAQAQQRS
jgi:hypothetical protein